MHIWQYSDWGWGVRQSIAFVKASVRKFNENLERESLDSDSYRIEVHGWHGRRICCLAFEIFHKDSNLFPNLEVLAYGDFTNARMDQDGVLIIRDPHLPSGCTIIPRSRLEAHTTVKSPLSFLGAFNKRPTTFWAHQPIR